MSIVTFERIWVSLWKKWTVDDTVIDLLECGKRRQVGGLGPLGPDVGGKVVLSS